ncbi:MAG TPA: bifunctional 4-hydroxy-2-oxoglutarate aldolase/2-dehydro-3-deoxy-phosphogluconate aldolase [Gemmatimonadales bacterium]|nr:bifunctional 4-hydroxy-2-oxoglutarate aldolase/2-dehydro-3-deoxy-phosphogluconate aldolase [Gemmatimonadales bacterium]
MTDGPALVASGVIAVVRLGDTPPDRLRRAAAAVAAGGVGAVEITLTTPGALAAIAELAADGTLHNCVIGAGTVVDEQSAREVIARGARFVVSPTLDRAVVRYCRDHDVPCLPGALTPTELLEAWRAGARLVKLFPAGVVGPRYLSEVLAPLPFLRVVPSGGVSLENAAAWIRAGAACVSVGTALVNPVLVTEQSWPELTARSRALVQAVAGARA